MDWIFPFLVKTNYQYIAIIKPNREHFINKVTKAPVLRRRRINDGWEFRATKMRLWEKSCSEENEGEGPSKWSLPS